MPLESTWTDVPFYPSDTLRTERFSASSFGLVPYLPRQTLRRWVRTDCQVVTERGFSLLGERSLDLSPRGMLVESEEDPTLGEPLLLSLRVPGTRQWIDTEGTIARVVRGRRLSDPYQGVGIRFAPLDPFSNSLLATSLKRYPPPLPTRQPRHDYAATIRNIYQEHRPWITA